MIQGDKLFSGQDHNHLVGLWKNSVGGSQSKFFVFINVCNFGFYLLYYWLMCHEILKKIIKPL